MTSEYGGAVPPNAEERAQVRRLLKERDEALAVIAEARASEERKHEILTGRKPTDDDSSQVWRILSRIPAHPKGD